MDDIKSIWDGWEKQCYGRLYGVDGERCALGHIARMFDGQTQDDVNRHDSICRVARYILQHYPVPANGTQDQYGNPFYRYQSQTVIVYANNVLKLTPDDFRRIDRETQIEAAVKPLVESIEAAQPAPNAERVEVGAR